MKSSRKVFYLFLVFSVLFFVGSIFDIKTLIIGTNFLIIPTLILYYRYKVKKWFLSMVIALLFFFIRDSFLIFGFQENPEVIIASFSSGVFLLYLFAIIGFQKSKVHIVEFVSLFIMYGFLAFLFYTMGELVPQVMPSFKIATYIYLLMLTVLVGITFTQYLIKSHYASLWLMLAAASLLVSELSLFFKLYIISDISVNIFYPFFHVIAYYAMVEHAVHRRRSQVIRGF